MINFNGKINNESILTQNRAFLYGDAVFETLKFNKNKILFFEDHYLRLMAAMRILRMKIPLEFTMEFVENEIITTCKENNLENARIRITVFRNDGGKYLPITNTVSYLIEVNKTQENCPFETDFYEIELYKDNYIAQNILSNIKTNNKIINTLASIYAHENDYHNCLLINDSKNIVEATNANFFMVQNQKIVTPPISQGCINGIMRKQILKIAKNIGIEAEEKIIAPFELQAADELFLTNISVGIQQVSKFRKKIFTHDISLKLSLELNKNL
jgi:branched-chain amino acid aminotransferase